MIENDLAHSAEIVVQDARERFSALWTAVGKGLSERREPADVGEQDGSAKVFFRRRIDCARLAPQALDDQARNIPTVRAPKSDCARVTVLRLHALSHAFSLAGLKMSEQKPCSSLGRCAVGSPAPRARVPKRSRDRADGAGKRGRGPQSFTMANAADGESSKCRHHAPGNSMPHNGVVIPSER